MHFARLAGDREDLSNRDISLLVGGPHSDRVLPRRQIGNVEMELLL